MNQVFVIIATSLKRTTLLIERSLISVYNQTGIDSKQIKVVVVDDNESSEDGLPFTFRTNCLRIAELRNDLNLAVSSFETFVMPNARTKNCSGTGAWNTGIYFAFQRCPTGFFAILDDDDEFLPQHIHHCLEVISNDKKVIAVFQELQWQNPDGNIWNFPLTADDMNESVFFIGNPGVQGSNMFFRTATIIKLGGFDETLAGSSDRDLMIRFLSNISSHEADIKSSVKIINSVGVIHHNHSDERVTKANTSKHKALSRFYSKHQCNFSEDAYHASIARALKLFNYKPDSDV